MAPTGIGILGCGKVSSMYLPNLAESADLAVVAVADVDLERARWTAREHGIPRACTPADLLADDAVEVVLNLTPIAAHVEVSKAALTAGRNVYSEKPLATTLEDAVLLVEQAARGGLSLACAPDTLLGSGFQVARDALAGDAIGRPLAASAGMFRSALTRRSFYTEGTTPIFDMAPYYLSALVNLFGPASRVSGSTRTWPDGGPPEETAGAAETAGTAGMAAGASISVTGTIEFATGMVATVVLAWGTSQPREVAVLDVYGSDGVLRVANPNNFGDPSYLRRHGADDWTELPGSRQPPAWRRNLRGLGVGEMVRALREGRLPRTDAGLACHVVEMIAGLVESAGTGRRVDLTTTCTPAPPMPEQARRELVGSDDHVRPETKG